MKSTHEHQDLQALYRHATRGLPNHADHRLTTDELLALAAGRGLGARQADALQGLAGSADQALLLRVLSDSQALADDMAAELAAIRRPTPVQAFARWWRSAGVPSVFATAGIAMMAVIGFRSIGSSPLPLPQAAQSAAAIEARMFDGAFEADDRLFAASAEAQEQSDQMFGGNFDS
jgi:hypothetical protein